ncbi:hypothetical protein ABID23_000831 [Bartonella silvatica]|uniref:Uncharacterized protein n=1 Tax=Bartonella silvatica TaxID=357760 RepID=A0ABV2HGU4_9HYPH
MKITYLVTAFTTFASIPVAQGASLITHQKQLVEEISSAVSSKVTFLSEEVSNALSDVFQKKFSCLDDVEGEAAIKLVAVKKRGPGPWGRGRGRPSLFTRNPLSF